MRNITEAVMTSTQVTVGNYVIRCNNHITNQLQFDLSIEKGLILALQLFELFEPLKLAHFSVARIDRQGCGNCGQRVTL